MSHHPVLPNDGIGAELLPVTCPLRVPAAACSTGAPEEAPRLQVSWRCISPHAHHPLSMSVSSSLCSKHGAGRHRSSEGCRTPTQVGFGLSAHTQTLSHLAGSLKGLSALHLPAELALTIQNLWGRLFSLLEASPSDTFGSGPSLILSAPCSEKTLPGSVPAHQFSF